MKKILLYIGSVLLALTLTGCFASANGAKANLGQTNHSASQASNESSNASDTANNEANTRGGIDADNYKSLTTFKL